MGVDRPATGSQENQCDAKCDQIDNRTGVWIFRDGAAQCKDQYHRSRDGGPQSHNYEGSVPNREQAENGGFRRLTSSEYLYSMNNESNAGDEPHEQEAQARPTKSEGRE